MRDEDLALSSSFRLTAAFLRRYAGYRKTLALTPENYRFDPVLWHSSLAVLRVMLMAVAEEEGLAVSEADVREAMRNLVEGIARRSREWDPE